MEVLGVILARAGSKGLPHKCLRSVAGRPLIEYTFDHALAASRLSAIVLTTDSPDAARRAAARGIETIDRPPELATDRARVDDAVRHAVEVWEDRHHRHVDLVVILYGNVPVRAAGLIDRAVQRLVQTGASSLRTVVPVGRHHPDWMYRLDGDRIRPLRDHTIYRRQDLEPLFLHDGAVIVVTRQALFDALATPEDPQAFLGPDRRALVVGPTDALDVDEPLDLLVAEALLATGGRVGLAAADHDAPDAFERPAVPLAGRLVGPGRPACVVAEIGVNHDGSIDQALRLVDAARHAGADAVKLQVFRADELACRDAPLAAYQQTAGAGSQRDMLRRLELSDRDLRRISEHCRACATPLLATPFSLDDVDRLIELDVAAIKIASTDLNCHPLLEKAAATGKPLILSTGAATASEIRAALDRLRAPGAAGRLILLHCVSAYPTPLEQANLRRIGALRRLAGLPVGFSDHTVELQTGAWAVAAGACLLEKHVTLDRRRPGPDHTFSLEPGELVEYIRRVRQAEAALGDGELGLSAVERPVRAVARRSIVAARDLPAGAVLTTDMLTFKRPGDGIAPDCLETLIGRRLKVDVPRDAALQWDMLQ